MMLVKKYSLLLVMKYIVAPSNDHHKHLVPSHHEKSHHYTTKPNGYGDRIMEKNQTDVKKRNKSWEMRRKKSG